jgi:hypothetical protein
MWKAGNKRETNHAMTAFSGLFLLSTFILGKFYLFTTRSKFEDSGGGVIAGAALR